LKNLVLPGIGSFTVVDGHSVSEADLGNNFFVDANSVGKSRASIITSFLTELNDLVSGHFLEKDPISLIKENPNYFTQFTLIIAADIPEEPLLQLSKIAFTHNIPIITIRAYGLIGHIRISIPEHTVWNLNPIIHQMILD